MNVRNLRHMHFSRAVIRWTIAVLLPGDHLAILLLHPVASHVVGIEVRSCRMPLNLHIGRRKPVMIRALVMYPALLHYRVLLLLEFLHKVPHCANRRSTLRGILLELLGLVINRYLLVNHGASIVSCCLLHVIKCIPVQV